MTKITILSLTPSEIQQVIRSVTHEYSYESGIKFIVELNAKSPEQFHLTLQSLKEMPSLKHFLIAITDRTDAELIY